VLAGGLVCVSELLDHLDLVVRAAVDGEADRGRADFGGVLDRAVDRRVGLAHPEVRRAVQFGEEVDVVLVARVVRLGETLLDGDGGDRGMGRRLESPLRIGAFRDSSKSTGPCSRPWS